MSSSLFTGKRYALLLLGVQLAKLIAILLHDSNPVFEAWFYGLANLPPYAIWEVKSNRPFDRTPYSLFWYLLNYTRVYGYWAWNLPMLVADSVTLVFLARRYSGFYIYSYVYYSFYFLLASPQDYVIYLMIVLGRIRWPFLGLAIATKLPLLPPYWWGYQSTPLATWRFMLTPGQSLISPDNWVRYGLLGSSWILSLVLRLNQNGRVWNRLSLILKRPDSELEFR